MKPCARNKLRRLGTVQVLHDTRFQHVTLVNPLQPGRDLMRHLRAFAPAAVQLHDHIPFADSVPGEIGGRPTPPAARRRRRKSRCPRSRLTATAHGGSSAGRRRPAAYCGLVGQLRPARYINQPARSSMKAKKANILSLFSLSVTSIIGRPPSPSAYVGFSCCIPPLL